MPPRGHHWIPGTVRRPHACLDKPAEFHLSEARMNPSNDSIPAPFNPSADDIFNVKAPKPTR